MSFHRNPAGQAFPSRLRRSLAAFLLPLLLPLSGPPDSAANPPARVLAYAPDAPPGGPFVPVRYGLLWLEIVPDGAHIALDGEFLDRGVWLISMAPGLHDLAVRKEGFRPWNRRIGIGPGDSLRIAVNLEADSTK